HRASPNELWSLTVENNQAPSSAPKVSDCESGPMKQFKNAASQTNISNLHLHLHLQSRFAHRPSLTITSCIIPAQSNLHSSFQTHSIATSRLQFQLQFHLNLHSTLQPLPLQLPIFKCASQPHLHLQNASSSTSNLQLQLQLQSLHTFQLHVSNSPFSSYTPPMRACTDIVYYLTF
ncbi:hypothetical protein BV898_18932, partial [Hypsibius exemplaris]